MFGQRWGLGGSRKLLGFNYYSLARLINVVVPNYAGNGAMHFESYLQRMVRMAATDQAVLEYYNTSLAERMKALVKEFTRIGVEDCEKFLYGGNMKRKQKNMASGNL